MNKEDEKTALGTISNNVGNGIKLHRKSTKYDLECAKPKVPKRLPTGRVILSYQAMVNDDINISINDVVIIMKIGN